MIKRDEFQQHLTALNMLVDPSAEDGKALLRKALRGRSNLLAARAAEIAGEWQLLDLHDDLLAGYAYFADDPVKRDPTCAAKFAIANALVELDRSDDELFLAGIRTVQLEPAYGRPVDTAAKLRAICALGLARSRYPDVLLELAQLLIDPEPDARLGAIQAIGQATEAGGLPLLWFKLMLGDPDPAVVYESMAVALLLMPERAVKLVAAYLLVNDVPTAESAALALGESRLSEAFPALVEGWEQSQEPAVRQTILLALAMLRDDEATEFLIQVLETGSSYEARDALAALQVYRDDSRLWRRVEKRVAARDDL